MLSSPCKPKKKQIHNPPWWIKFWIGLFILGLYLLRSQNNTPENGSDLFSRVLNSFINVASFTTTSSASPSEPIHTQLNKKKPFVCRPANILLSTENIPVLVDFGFAERYEMNSHAAFQSNLSYGTPEYLSPERARGLLHDTRKSDVWSLGITFFEILMGRTPFEHSEGEQFATKEDLENYWARTVRCCSSLALFLVLSLFTHGCCWE